MLNGGPYLRIRKPSTTTVEFTVSTRPLRPTLLARVLAALSLLLRLVVGGLVVAVNGARWEGTGTSAGGGSTPLPLLGRWVRDVEPGVAERHEWWLVPLVSLVVGYAVVRRGYKGSSGNTRPGGGRR